ncbi:MAG TPA: IS110 family transposase [Gemmatimonadaceae bacterium]|nr:IS110 family transposase [Gemmatimonadaceae bacterium]
MKEWGYDCDVIAPMVQRLQCFGGISLYSAIVLAIEIVDWRRFERQSQLACYLGLGSREDSSGDRTRLGSITKAGNSHCRHVLVQAGLELPASTADRH